MGTSGKVFGGNLIFTLDLQGGGTPTDISAWVMSVDGLPGERDFADITTGGSAGHKNYPGLHKATITVHCVFDDAANSAWSIVKDYLTDTTTRSFLFEPAGTGSTTGYVKITGECRIKKVSMPVKSTEFIFFDMTIETDGTITIGVVT